MAVAIPEQAIGDRTRAEALALELARQFLAEVQAGTSRNRPLTLDSALDDNLGLDSLSRVELAARIEHAFGANLPEQELASAATLRDLLAALRSATKTSPTAAPAVPPTYWVEAVQAEPVTVATLVEMLDWHVQAHRDRVHIVHLGDSDETHISYQELQRHSNAIGTRPGAGSDGGDHAADLPGVLPHVLRHPSSRRHPRADLSARTTVADRGTCAAPCEHPGERADVDRSHGARGARGCAAARGSRGAGCAGS